MVDKYIVKIYPSAVKDIDSICDYLSNELSNPKAANNFIEELQESFQTLIVFPKMYPLIDNIFVDDQSIRKMPVKKYLVFYRLVNKEIQVIRVIHGRSDYVSLLLQQ